MIIRRLLFLIFKFILGGESGASFSWSKKWQDKKPWYSEVPELLDAILLAHVAVSCWGFFFDMSQIVSLGISHYHIGLSLGTWLFFFFGAIAYAGIQSATWMFLNIEGHQNPSTTRGSTTKPVVDWLAGLFGWKLGDEGHAWTAATVKGAIICLPVGLILAPLGGLLFAAGYKIEAVLERWLKWGDKHWLAEGLSFVGIGIFYLSMFELFKEVSTWLN